MSRLDHVIIAVKDADVTCKLLLDHLGLASYAAGRIIGIGTESYIVPIGAGYLELISVCEERQAVANPLGRAVQQATADAQAKFLTWAVEPGDSVQPTADRLGLSANPMKRALPDGGDVTCRIAGLQQALDEPPLPYFVEWSADNERPDKVFVEHRTDPTGFAWIDVAGNKQQMTGWLKDPTLPLQFVEGSPGIQAVGIITEGEPLILREPLDFAALPQREFAQPGLQDNGTLAALRLPASPVREVGGRPPPEANPSMLESVLDRVETAIESAAEVVEHVAGDIISPRSTLAAESSRPVSEANKF